MKKIFFIILLLLLIPAVILGFSMRKQLTTKSKQENEVSVLARKTTIAPAEIQYEEHSKKPLLGNQWYSSAIFTFPSQPVYAFPLTYQFSESGIGIGHPDVDRTPKAVFGTHKNDFRVGYSSAFKKPEVMHVGDWSIGMRMVNQSSESASFTIAHGVPFTAFHLDGKSLKIQFSNAFSMYDDNAILPISSNNVTTDAMTIVVNNHTYVFFTDSKRTVTKNNLTLTIDNPKRLFIGLLEDRDQYANFKAIADTEIIGTQVTPEIEGESVKTTYNVITNGKVPLIALYPHQYDYLESKPTVIASYDSIRGPLRLVSADTFTTVMPKIVPPDTFESLSDVPEDLRASLKKDIAAVIKEGPPESRDYFMGVWLGRVISLLQLADMAKMEEEKTRLLKFIRPIVIESMSYFSYDTKKTSVIAKKPEFGNEELNDHHFQYSYFIRAAAVLGEMDPSILPSLRPRMTEMVQDIANTDRKNPKFPFLRHFDAYEAHSWADGDAFFADGNNQESTSEAMNAWYAVYLWGKVSKDQEVEKYGLYMYNTEMQGTQYYWFDKKNVYSEPYNHKIASIVWGGKVDFATWFSPDANKIYGIQLLPFTPASAYLGTLPDFAKYDKDFHASGGSEYDSWGDLFVMWKSFYQPKEMLALKDKVTKLEEANTRSLFLYTLYANAEK